MIQFVIWHLKKLLNKSIKCSIPIIIICFPFSTVYAKEGVGDKWRNIVEQNPEERLEDNWEIKEDTSFFDSLNIRVRDEEYPEKTKIYRWDISSDGRIAILLDSVNILEIFDNNGNYIVGFDIDYRDDIQIKPKLFTELCAYYLAHIHSLESTHSASLCRGVAPKRVDYPYTLIKGHL